MGCGKELSKGKQMFIAKIKCNIFGHSLVFAGSCSFTGLSYNYCERCELMLPKEGQYVE